MVTRAHVPLLLLLGCTSQTTTNNPPSQQTGTFPAGFLWGTATAGFQVEGGCPTLAANECEDPNSDWYAFVHDADARADEGAYLSGDSISSAPGFYELYAADIARAKTELGNNAFRLGMEWSRIFPAPTFGVTEFADLRAQANPAALAFYHRVLDEVRAQGMKPMVTIHHYTFPLWMHDGLACHTSLSTCRAKGWLDTRVVEELAKFSGFLAQEFGGKVDLWVTQNEPIAVLLAGYVQPSETRTNPPYVRFQFSAARDVVANMQLAHARQYDAVKLQDSVDADADGKTSRVGVVLAIAPVSPKDPTKGADIAAAEDCNKLYNLSFLNTVVNGQFDDDLDGVAEYREDLDHRLDFVGVNYYTRIRVESTAGGAPAFPTFSALTTFNPLTLEQGDVYPQGIYDAVKMVSAYNLPIIITENGTPDPMDDGTAPRFMVQHLVQLSRAIDEGVNVEGYFYWTLTDNFEWNHGMGIRMGLYAVDKNDPTKTRVARQLVPLYREIASSNRVPDALKARYAP